MNTAFRHPYVMEAALDLAQRGLAVFPIEPWIRRPQIGWQKTATTDPALIERRFAWFARFTNQASGVNIGVACRASNIVVLDLDRHTEGPDGVAGWEALCADHQQTPPTTFTAVTPNGGLHVYFQAPADATITSSSGLRPGLPPGIDVRAPGRRSGGYVMGPGSQVKAGRYKIAHDAPLLALPPWLANLLQDATPGAR
jgi:hypothetical protein